MKKQENLNKTINFNEKQTQINKTNKNQQIPTKNLRKDKKKTNYVELLCASSGFLAKESAGHGFFGFFGFSQWFFWFLLVFVGFIKVFLVFH